MYGVKVFVECAVTCDKMHRGSVFIPIVYECCVELLNDVLVFVAKCHVCVSLAFTMPYFIVNFFDFAVNLGFDV